MYIPTRLHILIRSEELLVVKENIVMDKYKESSCTKYICLNVYGHSAMELQNVSYVTINSKSRLLSEINIRCNYSIVLSSKWSTLYINNIFSFFLCFLKMALYFLPLLGIPIQVRLLGLH